VKNHEFGEGKTALEIYDLKGSLVLKSSEMKNKNRS